MLQLHTLVGDTAGFLELEPVFRVTDADRNNFYSANLCVVVVVLFPSSVSVFTSVLEIRVV